MDIDVTLRGDWVGVSNRLRRFDSGDLQREYRKGIVKATRGAGTWVKATVPAYLPSGGGYAGIITGALRVKTHPLSAGVRISGKAMGVSHERQVAGLEGGALRAPSYPRGRRARWNWHKQAVKPGFFTKPITAHEPEIRAGVINAMQDIADKIVGG